LVIGMRRNEDFALRIQKHDAEHLVVDQAAQKLPDALEQGVEIEDGGQLHRDLVENREGLRLARDASIEPRVFDGLRNAGRGEGQQVQVFRTEVAGLLAFQIHDADKAVFGDQRDGKLGAHIGIGRDIDRRSRYVIEQNRLAGEGNLADHSLAQGETHAFGFRGMADLEAHPEFMGAVVEKKDGEDAVVDDGADQFGGPVEQGLQVQCGIERVGKLHQVREVRGLNAHIHGIEMRCRSGPVVAFILRLSFVGRMSHGSETNDKAGTPKGQLPVP
jgi:hypothetical protein